jgi:hypothetical protein
MNSIAAKLKCLSLGALLWTTACSSDPQDPSTAGTAGSTATSGSSASASGGGGNGGSGGGSSSSGTGGSSATCKALFCDDFEAMSPQSEPGGVWSTTKTMGEVTVDTTRFFSGKQSVKLSTGQGGYKNALINFSDPSVLPTAGNVVYGRMMFYLDSAPSESVHWTFIAGQGPVTGKGYSAIYRYGGQLPISENGAFVGNQLMANYETPDAYQSPPVGPKTDCWNHSEKKVVPVGKWTCAEWKFDGATNSMEFWLDGAELHDMHVTGTGQGCVSQPKDYTWTAPSFEQLSVGWESYQTDAPRTIWIDDVAIGTQQIGCP